MIESTKRYKRNKIKNSLFIWYDMYKSNNKWKNRGPVRKRKFINFGLKTFFALLLSLSSISCTSSKMLINKIFLKERFRITSTYYILGMRAKDQIRFRNYPLTPKEEDLIRIYLQTQSVRAIALSSSELLDSLVIETYVDGKLSKKIKITPENRQETSSKEKTKIRGI